MIKTVLFDLDGTLLNTIDDLADAGNWVCAQNGWPTFTVAQFKLMVGNGIPKLVERFSPADARTPAQLAATLAQFTARYDAHKEDKTAPYPGIPALLDALKAEGIQCAVFSNKADALCGGIIAHYFGTGRFAAVRGNRPGVPTKPDPTGLYALMTELGADPSATLFVGDSDVDILTGHNAHLPAMGALWGFRGRAELTAAGADALAEVPEDILRYVQEQNKYTGRSADLPVFLRIFADQDADSSGSTTTGQVSYNSMGSKSTQLPGSRSPFTSHAAVSFRTVRRLLKKASSCKGAKTPPSASSGFASYRRTEPSLK